ncbi:MAG: hypothetical protein K6F53_03555 [Lachnospiraceae bacterium]|nr:hypothetical protein [Lachnospiraceae bacterium]
MTIGGIGSYLYTPLMQGSGITPGMQQPGAEENAAGAIGASQNQGRPGGVDAAEKKPVVNPGESDKVKPGRKSSPAECETCKERKYQDGSDEMVSFKSAQHISPEAAATRVRAHEQEHVSNAYKKAAQKDGKVLQASVSIKMAICPECGRSYVAGGETATKIRYPNDKFSKNRKSAEADAVRGRNFDMAV